VSALTTSCALVIALVAFVNAGALLSLWIVGRVPGLSLRRALGASPRLVALYVLFDLVVTTLPSTGAGLAAGVLARKWLPLQVGPLVVGAALGLMVTGAILAGLVLTRTVDLVDPGLLLRRGV
jgi:ABC-type antimicrobial peptide transport system permease subunit